jgi:hypothetical protein
MAIYIEKQYQKSPLGAVVEDSMTSGSKINAPSINAVQNAFSNPNLLINGDFQVWQRGTSFTFSKDQAIHYHADRWALYNTNITINKVESGEYGKGLYANGEVQIFQKLETNLETGKKYMISLQLNNSIIVTQAIIGGTYGSYGRIVYSKHDSGHDVINITL